MGGCIFCKVARKEIPAKICAESSKVVAFHDINPQAPVHILIIPKDHLSSVLDMDSMPQETLKDLFLTAKKLAVSEGVDKTGFRLVLNHGSDGGQSVDHVHMHLLGKRKLNWPPG